MSLTIDDFALGNKIGRGRFGHVYKVQKKDTKQISAMKVLYKAELQQHGILHQLIKEVDIQSKLRHKYILKLLWVFQDEKRVYIFTDIAPNGNLYHYLKRLTKFPEDVSGKYLRQLVNALIYIHQKSIIHRDIKPENLLIAPDGNLLLADFGWCTEIAQEEGRLTICGTPEYLPPEMVSHQRYSDTVDSWTCGILLFEFLTGSTPFTGLNQHDIYGKVTAGKYTCPSYISDGAKSFITVSLRTDPLQRYTAGELFLLPWTQAQNESGRSVIDYEDSLGEVAPMSSSSSPSVPSPFKLKPCAARTASSKTASHTDTSIVSCSTALSAGRKPNVLSTITKPTALTKKASRADTSRPISAPPTKKAKLNSITTRNQTNNENAKNYANKR